MTNTNGSTTATVETLRAEVRVLQVGSRQITQSVARQLDDVPFEEIEVFGRIHLYDADDRDRVELIGRHIGTGALVRSWAIISNPRYWVTPERLSRTQGAAADRVGRPEMNRAIPTRLRAASSTAPAWKPAGPRSSTRSAGSTPTSRSTAPATSPTSSSTAHTPLLVEIKPAVTDGRLSGAGRQSGDAGLDGALDARRPDPRGADPLPNIRDSSGWVA